MSYDVDVNEFDYLSDMRVNVFTKSGDVLKAKSDTANSLNVWVSYIDSIST